MGVISSLTERGLVNERCMGGIERLKTNWCRDDREFGGGINDGVVLQLHVDDAGAARYACKSWSSAATSFFFF